MFIMNTLTLIKTYFINKTNKVIVPFLHKGLCVIQMVSEPSPNFGFNTNPTSAIN